MLIVILENVHTTVKKLFKGDRIQFEFNTQLLDCLDLAIFNLSKGNLLAVQEHLQKTKSDLEKRITGKLICFADKSPLTGLQLRNMTLTNSPKILKTSRNLPRLRPRPHVSGYFSIRNFLFPDSKISPSTRSVFKSNSPVHTHAMVSGFTLVPKAPLH